MKKNSDVNNDKSTKKYISSDDEIIIEFDSTKLIMTNGPITENNVKNIYPLKTLSLKNKLFFSSLGESNFITPITKDTAIEEFTKNYNKLGILEQNFVNVLTDILAENKFFQGLVFKSTPNINIKNITIVDSYHADDHKICLYSGGTYTMDSKVYLLRRNPVQVFAHEMTPEFDSW